MKWIWKKNCIKCKLLEKENKYLQTLVDRFLIMNGVSPVSMGDPQVFDIDKELAIPEEKNADGSVKEVEKYGS